MKIRPSIFFVLILPSLPWSKPINANIKAVLSAGSVEFPNAAPGIVYQVQKVWNPITKSIEFRSNSSDIPDFQSLERLRQEDFRLEKQKYGAVSKSLRMKLDSLQDDDEIQVVVSVKFPQGITHPSKFVATQSELEAHGQLLLTLQPVVSINELFRSHNLNLLTQMDNSSGIASMKKSQIKDIMFDDRVMSIEEFKKSKSLTKAFSIVPSLFTQSGSFHLIDLAQSAYNHSSASVFAGAGNNVHAATFENGVDFNFMQCAGFFTSVQQWDPILAGQTYIDESKNINDSLHSLQCFWLLHDAAPAALLYHRRSLGFSFLDSRAYLFNNRIQTASMSVAKINDPTSVEFVQMDEFAYKVPYTVFCNPAGNDGLSLETGWGSYNSINVGSVRHLNQNHFYIPQVNSCLGACSQSRNPPQRAGYGGPCITRSDYGGCASDREMPQIVAPGQTDQTSTCVAVPGAEPCLKYHDGWQTPLWCGTSWSAPIANGIAADIIAANSRMFQSPEKVRATMFITAENVDGGEWDEWTDGNDGAGVIDGASAVNFAKTAITSSPGASAVGKGIASGQINSSNFTPTLGFNILAPNSIPPGKNLRVVLTWDSSPAVSTGQNDLSDLDLSSTVNGNLYMSQSWESNVEIINIPGNVVTPNSIIPVTIIPQINRISSAADAQYIFYAIGWDWTATTVP